MNLPEDFELENEIKESGLEKIEVPHDLNFRSSTKPQETGGEEMKLPETISLSEQSGIAEERNNNLKSTQEFGTPKDKSTKGETCSKENEIIKKINHNRFYEKCQENAKKWMEKGHRIKFDEKNEKKTRKAKYFEDTRDWELHIKRFKSALTETYINGNKLEVEIDQKNSSEKIDSENDEILREKALLSLRTKPKSLLPEKANISNIQKDREDDIDKAIIHADYLSSQGSRLLSLNFEPQPALKKSKPQFKKTTKTFCPNEALESKPPFRKLIVDDSDSSESNSLLEQEKRTETEKETARNCSKNSSNEISQNSLASKVASKNDVSRPQVIKQLSPLEQEKYISMKKEILKKEMKVKGNSKKSEAKPIKHFLKNSISPKLKESQQSESSQYSEDLNEFANFIEKVEKEFKEYMQYKEEVAQMRKKFSLMQNKMFLKQRLLIMKKSNVDKKNENISIKLDEISKKSEGQVPVRDSELLKLKLREVSLRSQITLHKIVQEVPESREMFMKSKMEPPQPPSKKKIVSVAECDQLDPFIPLCPFDLNGWCNDDECKYQHVLKF